MTVKRTVASLGRGGDATDPDPAPAPDRRRGSAARGGAPALGDRPSGPRREKRAGGGADGRWDETPASRTLLPPGAPPPAPPGPPARPPPGTSGRLPGGLS